MKNKILTINPTCDLRPLFGFFKALQENNTQFVVYSHDSELLKKFSEIGSATKKIKARRSRINLFESLALFIGWPILFVLAIFKLLIIKTRAKINALCLGHARDLIIYSLAGRILRLKILYLVCPGANPAQINPILRPCFRALLNKTDIITFNSHTASALKKLKLKKEATVLYPGLARINQHQDTIFTRLAEADRANRRRKFFSLGTALDLSSQERLETLFTAVKKTLEVIPNLQLIVVGDGSERKAQAWLTKRLGIDTVVWFVGEQTYLKKWLDNLDIYIVSCADLKLRDINACLEAGSSGLPIIAPIGIGLEDIITHEKTGLLVAPENSEQLAQAIIALHQNKRLKRMLGDAAKAHVDKSFTIDKMVNKFNDIIKEV